MRTRVAARRGHWFVAATVALAAVVIVSAGGASRTAAIQQDQHIDHGITATAGAVRGRSVAVTKPPPPPVLYPTGRCDNLTAGLPGLNQLFASTITQIGTSVQGRPIWAEYWGPPKPAAVMVVVAQIHGNECSPTLLTDEIRRRPPTRNGIWLIPTLNPDGYANYDRRNANDVDLNADGGRVSQPETAALFGFLAAIRPALTVHVHSPNGFIGAYPTQSVLADALCHSLEARIGSRCSAGGAGTRGERSRLFLWQGHEAFTAQSLLIELHAVANTEVTTARPRPQPRSVDAVRLDSRVIIGLLDQVG